MRLGWNDFFQAELERAQASELAGAVPARVVGEERGFYRLQRATDATVWGEISGKLRYKAQSRMDFPAVGDWVLCDPDTGSDRALIHGVLKRKTCLVRKAAGEDEEPQIFAANIDTIFIAASLGTELNVRRLERYLTMAWDSGAQPVILLTKDDLVSDAAPIVTEATGVAAGAPVHCLSNKTGHGIDVLAQYLTDGKTAVIIGPSGVGKSTLINRLVGSELLKTGETRDEDHKGRHTTTSRYLVHLPKGGPFEGAMLIDTPGIREIQLLENEEGLERSFPEIDELASKCKFNDCGHETEPGCAIRAGLSDGTLEPERWESYQRLQREIAYQARKTDKAVDSAARKNWRKIHNELKQTQKRKRGNYED